MKKLTSIKNARMQSEHKHERLFVSGMILDQKDLLLRGFGFEKVSGLVKSISASGIEPEDLPRDLDIKIPDHLIIATALKAQRESTRKIILVSRDINMRVIADAVGLTSEDFQNNQVVDTSENIFDRVHDCFSR